jgi:hypothetical protein
MASFPADSQAFGKRIFDSVERSTETTPNGFGEADLINDDAHAQIGLLAKDADSYTVFAPLFEQFKAMFFHSAQEGNAAFGAQLPNHDEEAYFVRYSQIKVSRNIKGKKFVPGSNVAEKAEVEEAVLKACDGLGGRYLKLSEHTTELIDISQFVPSVPKEGSGDYAKSNADWPAHRGVYQVDGWTYVWVNAREHVEIMTFAFGADFNSTAQNANRVLEHLSKSLEWAHHDNFGYLNSVPNEIGNGVKASIYAKLPFLAAKGDEFFTDRLGSVGLRGRYIAGDTRTRGKLIILSSSHRFGDAGKVVEHFNAQVGALIAEETAAQIAPESPPYAEESHCLAKKNLTNEYWNQMKGHANENGLRFYMCLQPGIESAHAHAGMFLYGPDAYVHYRPLIDGIVQDYHGYPADGVHPQDTSFPLEGIEHLDPEGKYINSTRIRTGRNLADFPLP